MADVTALGFCYGDLLLAAVGGFFEGNFHVVTEIVTALRLGRILASTAAEQILKDSAATEDFAEDLERIMGTAAAESACPAIEGAVAVLIVEGAFLGIAQDFVSFTEFLELFFGCFIAGIFVRVIFYGELAVGFLDFLVGSCSLNREDFVIIAFGHGSGAGLFGDYDTGWTKEAVTKLITFAKLLDDLAFGQVVGF